MTHLLVFAQLANSEQGWLTQKLLSVTPSAAEGFWCLLAVLSVLSIAVMLERALYFSSHGITAADDLSAKLTRGELDAVRAALRDKKGMEANVLREALEHATKGPDAVEEVIAATVAREKPQ